MLAGDARESNSCNICSYAVVEMYELSGKHTYLSMAIVAGTLVIMLILLAALYKELAPRPTQSEDGVEHHVTATFDTKEQEVTGMHRVLDFTMAFHFYSVLHSVSLKNIVTSYFCDVTRVD